MRRSMQARHQEREDLDALLETFNMKEADLKIDRSAQVLGDTKSKVIAITVCDLIDDLFDYDSLMSVGGSLTMRLEQKPALKSKSNGNKA